MKVTAAEVHSDDAHLLSVGNHGWVRGDGAVGTITGPVLGAEWDLRFEPVGAELRHLPAPWMYRARVPRTKATSPYPDMHVTGTVTVAGRTFAVDGWRGMLGHNWGAEHAHRWIWLRGAGFAEDPDAWLDVVIGRIKVGPIVLPWIANGVLSHDGMRHRVGGLGRRVPVVEHAAGCEVVLPGRDVTLNVHATAPAGSSVGWQYTDPAGGKHQVRNCSVAGVSVDVRDGARTRRLTTQHGGVYEAGGAELDPRVVMQPYPDA